MATITAPSSARVPGVKPLGSEIGRTAARASRSAFAALLLRDLRVLIKNLKEFLPRTVIQPLLLVFVFLYVFPKIGQGIGGSAGANGGTATGANGGTATGGAGTGTGGAGCAGGSACTGGGGFGTGTGIIPLGTIPTIPAGGLAGGVNTCNEIGRAHV